MPREIGGKPLKESGLAHGYGWDAFNLLVYGGFCENDVTPSFFSILAENANFGCFFGSYFQNRFIKSDPQKNLRDTSAPRDWWKTLGGV